MIVQGLEGHLRTAWASRGEHTTQSRMALMFGVYKGETCGDCDGVVRETSPQSVVDVVTAVRLGHRLARDHS